MTIFNTDPQKIGDIDTLREMVFTLQQMVNNLQQMQEVGRNLQDLLYEVNVQQGEKIDLLTQLSDSLHAQVANNKVDAPLRAN